jgi:hypothetical protein
MKGFYLRIVFGAGHFEEILFKEGYKLGQLSMKMLLE